MNKQISVFLSILFITFFIYHGSYANTETIKEPALVQIMKVLEQQPVEINEWSLYARESLAPIESQKEFNMKTLELKEEFQGFKWEFKRESETWRAVGTLKHEDMPMEEKIQLVWTPKKERTYTYLLYSAKGDQWEENQPYTDMYDNRYHKLFTSNPTIFSCVEGQFSDKMESVLSLKVRQLLNEFRAEPRESLVEESFVSMSAYTEMWEEALPTEQHRMNLQ
ncbi:MAG TPA: YwmB family TATA-box binding protein, partial [Bacillus sp. (in: firmicutes)]|nr:YwmB family TATA-box binding protein [Bacillus sp. (in: firmicutes)]